MMLNCVEIQLLHHMDNEDRKALSLWMREYWPIIIKDLEKILGNKFLICETLLRIIDNISLLE